MDLGVHDRVVVLHSAIVAAADDFAVSLQDGPDGDAVRRETFASLRDRGLHVFLVVQRICTPLFIALEAAADGVGEQAGDHSGKHFEDIVAEAQSESPEKHRR